MDTITIILIIALVITIVIAIIEYEAAKKWKKDWGEAAATIFKNSDKFRLKDFEIDRLVKELAECQKKMREEETRGA